MQQGLLEQALVESRGAAGGGEAEAEEDFILMQLQEVGGLGRAGEGWGGAEGGRRERKDFILGGREERERTTSSCSCRTEERWRGAGMGERERRKGKIFAPRSCIPMQLREREGRVAMRASEDYPWRLAQPGSHSHAGSHGLFLRQPCSLDVSFLETVMQPRCVFS